MSILVNVEELCLIKHQKVWRCWTVTTRYQKKPTNYFSHDFLISGLNTNLAGHSAQCTVKNEPKKWIRSAKTAKRHTASGLCKLITKLPSFDTYTSKTSIQKKSGLRFLCTSETRFSEPWFSEILNLMNELQLWFSHLPLYSDSI